MRADFVIERHCVGSGESENSHASCSVQTRDYDIPLRIGTLFVILVTSAIGVFAPILLMKLPFATINGVVSTVIKQFGTGIILSTAFVHVSHLMLYPQKWSYTAWCSQHRLAIHTCESYVHQRVSG